MAVIAVRVRGTRARKVRGNHLRRPGQGKGLACEETRKPGKLPDGSHAERHKCVGLEAGNRRSKLQAMCASGPDDVVAFRETILPLIEGKLRRTAHSGQFAGERHLSVLTPRSREERLPGRH